MRIHKLHLSNIASLQGEHTIDFDEILSEQSLFAITGKTGSGKSSLLNAISLALYGKVYKSNSSSNDFVTLGQAVGSIDLYFSNQNQQYLASWNLKIRKKNGDLLKKPQLTRAIFVKKDNEYVATDKSCEQLIHLSFDQFCKTSILNQGEFAKFITSSFIERKGILEKFYDGIKLENLNQKLLDKLKLKKDDMSLQKAQIEGLEQSIADINIDETEIKEWQKKFADLSRIKSYINDSYTNFKEILFYHEQYHQNLKKTKQLSTQIDEKTKELNEIKSKLAKLNMSFEQIDSKYKQDKPILEQCIRYQIEIEKNNEQIDYLNSEISELKDKKKKLQHKAGHVKSELETTSKKKQDISLNKVDHLSASIPTLVEVDQELQKNKYELEVNANTLELESKNKSDIEGLIEKLKNEMKGQSLEDYKRKITELEHKKSKKVHEQEKTKAINEEYKKNLESTQNIKNQILDLEQKKQDLESKLNQIDKELININLELETSKDTLNTYELHKAVKFCLDQSDDSCVVCHSKINNKDDLNQNISEKLDSKLDFIELKIKDLEHSKKDIEEIKIRTQLSLDDLNIKITELKEAHRLLEDKIISMQEISLENIIDEVRLIDDEITDLKIKVNQFTKNKEELQNLKNKDMTLNKRLDELKQNTKALESKQKSLYEKLETLGYEFTSTEQLRADIKQLELGRELTSKISQFTKDLNEIDENLETNSKKMTQLSQSVSEYKNKNEKFTAFLIENLGDSELSAKNKLTEYEQELSGAREKLTQIREDKNKAEIEIAELNSKLETGREQLKSIELQIKSLLNLIDQSQENFSDDKHQDKIVYVFKTMQKLQSIDLEDHSTLQILQPIFGKVEQINHDFNHEVSELSNELTKKLTLLEQKTKALEKVKTIKKELKDFHQEYEKLENLYELIGRDEFRNYILANIEYTLIQQANIELKNLYDGRFAIAQSHKRNRLLSEFKIIDYYNDGEIRNMSTLSGGETFLVSIAMALALAELTRGHTQLDSLFIDEGFGTLDSEAIDEVFELLVSIQHTGKQLGIISHIQPLTNRFPINIHLNKNSLGKSQTKIIYN